MSNTAIRLYCDTECFVEMCTHADALCSLISDEVESEDDRRSPKQSPVHSPAGTSSPTIDSSLSIRIPSPKSSIPQPHHAAYPSMPSVNGHLRYPPHSWMSGMAGMLQLPVMSNSSLPVVAYSSQSGAPLCWDMAQLGYLPSMAAKTS